MARIKGYDFDSTAPGLIRREAHGKNWPVVYIINNDDEAYVGETTNASNRTKQHLSNPERQKLNTIHIIDSDKFNKSATLDLESFLIQYMSADAKFRLQNSNFGQQNSDYYDRKNYEESFREIWTQLKSLGLVENKISYIKNSDLFKYSPFKNLTDEQELVVDELLESISTNLNKKSNYIIRGGAGTGKTVLAIYLVKLLAEAAEAAREAALEDDKRLGDLRAISSKGAMRVGLVVPMVGLRKTIRKVFANVKGLSADMVLSPNEVARSSENFDLLIVDESHRLRQRKNLTNYKTHDENNVSLGLGDGGTELDWIILKSRHVVLFYDEKQSVRPTDVERSKFVDLVNMSDTRVYDLNTQLRCQKGGKVYIDYVRSIFSNNPPKDAIRFKDYDFKIFDNPTEMIEEIKALNDEYGLCRNIGGFAWKWNTKKNPDSYDIELDGHKYVWNRTVEDWINSEKSVEEIGSIHTTQGFDLNYAGVIIGNDLKYNPYIQRLYVSRENYYDVKGKNGTTDDELLNYILNIYSTMCTRGMLGTYIYVCDDNLRDYLKKYIASR